MSMLAAAFWFFGGIATYVVLRRILSAYRIRKFVLMSAYHSIRMLGLVAANIVTRMEDLRHVDAESGVPELLIKTARTEDSAKLQAWLDMNIGLIIKTFPSEYQTLFPFNNWNSADEWAQKLKRSVEANGSNG